MDEVPMSGASQSSQPDIWGSIINDGELTLNNHQSGITRAMTANLFLNEDGQNFDWLLRSGSKGSQENLAIEVPQETHEALSQTLLQHDVTSPLIQSVTNSPPTPYGDFNNNNNNNNNIIEPHTPPIFPPSSFPPNTTICPPPPALETDEILQPTLKSIKTEHVSSYSSSQRKTNTTTNSSERNTTNTTSTNNPSINNNNNTNSNNSISTSNTNSNPQTQSASHSISTLRVFPNPPPQPLAIAVEPQNSSAFPVIESIKQSFEKLTNELEVDKTKQAQLARSSISKEQLNKLDAKYALSYQSIQNFMTQIDHIYRTQILSPMEIQECKDLKERLFLLLTKSDLIRKELTLLSGGKDSSKKSVAALVLTNKPPPQVLFKGKGIGFPFVVELVTDSRFDCDVVSEVKAVLSKHETSSGSAGKKTAADGPSLENDSVPLDATSKRAVFDSVKINISTRMNASHIKFGLKVKDRSSGVITTLESNLSNGIISITNESQWPDASGKSVINDAFEGKNETSWPQYCNTLQWHLLLATNQAPISVVKSESKNGSSSSSSSSNSEDDAAREVHRKLYNWEFNYIHTKFFGGDPIIKRQQAEQFWVWFGQVLMGVHFKRHILPLWQIGGIYGMITKEECVAALEKYPEGTFLVRFSESLPGAFAIGYSTDDGDSQTDRVKHFLVKTDDIGANKTLPDFLKDKPQFKTLLQLSPSTRETHPIDKDEILNSYYSKRKVNQIGPGNGGYVLL